MSLGDRDGDSPALRTTVFPLLFTLGLQELHVRGQEIGQVACSLLAFRGEPQAGPEVMLEPSLGSGCVSYTRLQLGFSTLPVGPPRGQVGTVCTHKGMPGTQFVPKPI